MARLQTTILAAGKPATVICNPDNVIEKLGAGKNHRLNCEGNK